MAHALSEEELVELFTGRVVESLGVKQDFATATVGCRTCADESELGSGDRVTVSLSCYEDHSWEMEGVYCTRHAVDSVADTMGLEAAGYYPPKGNFEPDALTLGAVEILDYSPTAEGY